MSLSRRLGKIFFPQAQYGYSQFGEDLILAHMFYHLEIHKPTYLDIGANEPRFISNTYFFYKRGSRGVLIEPNPHLCKKLRSIRPYDIILNTGVGFREEAEANFYIFPDYANGLSTFSEKEAKHWENTGMKGIGKIPVEKIIKMPLVTVNSVMHQYFDNKAPDFISLDVEGLDLQILTTLDLNKYRPYAICVETMAYDENQHDYKLTDVNDFMITQGYEIYADTRVNTIYCRHDIFKKSRHN